MNGVRETSPGWRASITPLASQIETEGTVVNDDWLVFMSGPEHPPTLIGPGLAGSFNCAPFYRVPASDPALKALSSRVRCYAIKASRSTQPGRELLDGRALPRGAALARAVSPVKT